MTIDVSVNGQKHTVDVDESTPVLWVLRDELNLVGTKFGCGVASCGACTIHIDGQPTRACVTPIGSVGDKAITTIESVNSKPASAVQTAWQELDVVQCGYCQSGQIMSAIGLLSSNPKPNDEDIDAYMNGNACRCATYHRIRAAIHRAAALLEA